MNFFTDVLLGKHLLYRESFVPEMPCLQVRPQSIPRVNYFGPDPGTVVYCALGPVEHSGVYVDDNSIIELSGTGKINMASYSKFTSNICTKLADKYRLICIPFLDCDSYNSLSNTTLVENAMSMLGHKRQYNIVFDNCHQFSSGCVTGSFENSDNFLWMLKDTISKKMAFGQTIHWYPWSWKKKILYKSNYIQKIMDTVDCPNSLLVKTLENFIVALLDSDE